MHDDTGQRPNVLGFWYRWIPGENPWGRALRNAREPWSAEPLSWHWDLDARLEGLGGAAVEHEG